MNYSIKKRKSQTKGYKNLSLRVKFDTLRTWDRSLGITVKESDYDPATKTIKSDRLLNQRLHDAISAYNATLLYLESIPGKFTKEQFIDEFNKRFVKLKPTGPVANIVKPKTQKIEYEAFLEYNKRGLLAYEILKLKEEKQKYGDIKQQSGINYDKLRSHVLRFRPSWRIQQIERKSLDEFKAYFYERDYGVYTFNRTLHDLKSVILYFDKYVEKIDHLEYILSDSFFKKLKFVPSPQPYFSPAELEQLFEFEFKDPEHAIVRDAILFGCYTALRVGDWDIRPEHRSADGTVLKYNAQKTGAKVSMEIHPRLGVILDRYDGYSPPVAPEGVKWKEALFNRKMKQVCKIAGLDRPFAYHTHTMKSGIKKQVKPLHEVVSSHDCRRTFATNMALAGYSFQMIRAFTGHTNDKSLTSYIQASTEEISKQVTKDMFIKVFGK